MPHGRLARAGARIGRFLRLLAYPQLRDLPPAQWEHALGRARGTPLDGIELAGIVAGVAFAAFALRPGIGTSLSLLMLYVEQFVLALPLLAILVGPFFLRRTRRGLDLQLAQRRGGHSWNLTLERQDGSRRADSARSE